MKARVPYGTVHAEDEESNYAGLSVGPFRKLVLQPKHIDRSILYRNSHGRPALATAVPSQGTMPTCATDAVEWHSHQRMTEVPRPIGAGDQGVTQGN